MLLVTIVPVGLFAAGLLYLHWQAQEREREVFAQIESVRLLAAALDNALDSTVQRISILARVWAANPGSDEAIHAQAREAVAANPNWRGSSPSAPKAARCSARTGRSARRCRA